MEWNGMEWNGMEWNEWILSLFLIQRTVCTVCKHIINNSTVSVSRNLQNIIYR